MIWSFSVLYQTILSNARMDRSKLDKKGHKVVNSPTAIAGRDQLNSAQHGPTFAKGGHKERGALSYPDASTQFRVLVSYFFSPFLSSFDLSNLSLVSWYFRLFPFYFKQFCPILDWTGQNWMKRDIKL